MSKATFVTIKDGKYRGKKVKGTFELVSLHKKTGAGKTVVQVDLTSEVVKGELYENDIHGVQDEFGGESVTTARVTVPNEASIEYLDEDYVVIEHEVLAKIAAAAKEIKNPGTAEAQWEEIEDEIPEESKEVAIDRIRARFDRLDLMSGAIIDGHIRGLIVAGPPGIGKSYGVEQLLDEENAGAYVGAHNSTSEIIKGSISAPGLYQILYKHSAKGHVVVFDDCDSVFEDTDCLNMLKSVLDSGDRRKVHWTKESRWLDREDLPTNFDFEGGVVFITNINLDREMAKGNKRAAHLNALVSRSHFIDLGIDCLRDVFLRIEQITNDGMIDGLGLSDHKQAEKDILAFIRKNHHRLRELSLRTVLKIAQLFAIDEDNWEELAIETCCMPNGRGRPI